MGVGILLSLALVFLTSGVSGTIQLSQLFYHSQLNYTNTGYCFRLTNATHQIGCSASSSHTRGVLYYVNESEAITRLKAHAPHAPYVMLMEPEFFTGDIVQKLRGMHSTAKGIIVRYLDNSTLNEDVETVLGHFSPERRCPNDDPNLSGSCSQGDYWNENASELIFTDFGDFPVFMIGSEDFDNAVECYYQYNNGSSGYGDFPLCSVELVADMQVAVDTPTCRRRANLPIPYLNGDRFCDPLGDSNVWGSLFKLTENNTNDVIMLAAKLDSISFFPNSGSFGASSEVAAMATMLAVIHQLGEIKRNHADKVNLTKQILYTFFQGETWDNIGSSRMAYDMKHGGKFPQNNALPRITLGSIGHFIEFGHLGLLSENTVYLHGDQSSDFAQYLGQVGNITVLNSSRSDLPPAALRRFISEGIKEANLKFSGTVISSFDQKFRNRFFGSRFDDINNFGGRSVSEVAEDLAAVATAVAKAVFNISEPTCDSERYESIESSIMADSVLIQDVLECFLSNSSCDLFRGVFRLGWLDYLSNRPLPRYVGTTSSSSLTTIVIQQLLALLAANNATELEQAVSCSSCLQRIQNTASNEPALNVTWAPHPEDNSMCLCVESFLYTHPAESPLFEYNLGYDSGYSAWAESVWTLTTVRFYLVTYPLQEVGFLFLGLFLTAITVAGSIQCTRKGTVIFATGDSFSVVTT